MSIVPIAAAAQLLPAALFAGKVATHALGSFAEMLREAIDLTPEGTSPVSQKDKLSESSDWPAEITSLLRDFTASFHQLLSDHELEPSEGIALRLSETGDVDVSDDHPQSTAIEALLARTPRLSELFRSLAAQATAHRKQQEFAAFQQNPQSTGHEFPLLFPQGNAPNFHLLLQGDQAKVAFH